MIKCNIRYYFRSNKRTVRFTRFANFAALPPEGSQLSLTDNYLKDDHLTVESITMNEDSYPTLEVESSDIKDCNIDDTIEFMKEAGWGFTSMSSNRNQWSI